MSTNSAEILAALLEYADTMAVGSPALPIAFPEHAENGRSFDPATDAPDGKYLEVRVFLNRHAWEGVTNGVLRQGLLQVEVVLPRNLGLIAPALLADEVAAHWAKNTVLFSGSTRVSIDREPQVHTALPEGSEVRVPISIPWTA